MDKKVSQQILKRLANHEKRIGRLERSVFSNGRQVQKQKTKIPQGPSGGIRVLIAEGFFKSKRDLAGVRKELESKNYHYSIQVINTALRRLAKLGGPLVVLKGPSKRNVYVERK